MEALMVNIEGLIAVTIAVLVAVQAVLNFVLVPEKAEKYNFIGKFLDILVRTKEGLSTQKENDGEADVPAKGTGGNA